MIKRALVKAWWAAKVGLFPHTERRKVQRPKPKISAADDMLATAIMDLTNAIEWKGNKHDVH